MPPTDFSQPIIDALNAIEFRPDELAYLALTSKVELPIRDCLAFTLHSALPNCFIAREWRRVDIAIFGSGDDPLALIELKAMHSYGMSTDEYKNAICEDAEKCRELSKASQIFTILLVTHFPYQPFDGPQGIIKYIHKMRRATKELAKHDMLLDAALREIRSWNPYKMDGEIRNPGIAFQIPVSVHYCLFGPY